MEKFRTSAIIVTLAIWQQMWKLTFEKMTHVQLMWICICSSRRFEETCENKYLKKSLTCNYCGDWRRFESKCENSHLRKSHTCNKCEFASGQVGHLRRHVKINKSLTCNYCDFASVQEGDLRAHVKTHIWENHTHATNVNLHLFK